METRIKIIFWDFDGVILDSNAVRELGFTTVLKNEPSNDVDLLINFHKENGGLSRYVKFRYFLEKIQGKSASEEDVNKLADQFSTIMKELLIDKKNLIEETLHFIQANWRNYTMFITSGSDQTELRYLCDQLDISKYFKSIHGSPKAKTIWIKELIEIYKMEIDQCLIIGDSINDFEAARDNKIHFMAYNNETLNHLNTLTPLY